MLTLRRECFKPTAMAHRVGCSRGAVRNVIARMGRRVQHRKFGRLNRIGTDGLSRFAGRHIKPLHCPGVAQSVRAIRLGAYCAAVLMKAINLGWRNKRAVPPLYPKHYAGRLRWVRDFLLMP